MFSKYVLVICSLVAITAAIPSQAGSGPAWGGAGWGGQGAGSWGVGANPWIPSWLTSAPWYTQRVSCTGIGTSCVDCSTRLVCTKSGGLQRACTDPKLPYCNLGECSSSPAVGC